MTVTIPKPVVALLALGVSVGALFFIYEELPALRRYIKFETM
jgi:hypothetical protein